MVAKTIKPRRRKRRRRIERRTKTRIIKARLKQSNPLNLKSIEMNCKTLHFLVH